MDFEMDHSVWPPQAYLPTKRGDKAAKGMCLSCRTKWTAVGEACSCPTCAMSWPDHIAERTRAGKT